MKRLLLLLAPALLLCQCADTGEGGEVAPTGYRLGIQKGIADHAAGLSSSPERYEAEYSSSDRDDFSRGYIKGYAR